MDGARWREEARARAAEHGLGDQEIVRLRSVIPAVAVRSEADVVSWLVERLSGPYGLTAKHNTFARRHVLAEAAGELGQASSVVQLERIASSYLEHESVVLLGAVGGEQRYTTRDLLAAEAAIVEGAQRRAQERTAMLDPGLADRAVSRLRVELTAEQAAAVRAVAGSGRGVDVIQALAWDGQDSDAGRAGGLLSPERVSDCGGGGDWSRGARAVRRHPGPCIHASRPRPGFGPFGRVRTGNGGVG